LADNEVLTYLQMISPDDLSPAPKPPVVLEVQELDRSSPLIRRMTVGIGRAHQWPSQGWDDQQWQAYLRRPHLRALGGLHRRHTSRAALPGRAAGR